MKSKRSKKCDISNKTRIAVKERDRSRCIWCGVHLEHPQMCHYISRQDGGLGIPENVVCGCVYCHQQADQGSHTRQYKQVMKMYLQSCYPDWNEKELRYKK